MPLSDTFFTYWWFHLPNLVMAALIYTLIGRYILELFFRGRDAVILSVFRSATDPVVKATRYVTPAIIANGLVIVFAIVWMVAIRMLWFLTCVAAGMRLNVGG